MNKKFIISAVILLVCFWVVFMLLAGINETDSRPVKFKVENHKIVFLNNKKQVVETIWLGETKRAVPAAEEKDRLHKIFVDYPPEKIEFIIKNATIVKTELIEYRVAKNNQQLLIIKRFQEGFTGEKLAPSLTNEAYAIKTVIQFFDKKATKLWEKDFIAAGEVLLSANGDTILVANIIGDMERIDLYSFDHNGTKKALYMFDDVFRIVLSEDGNLFAGRAGRYTNNQAEDFIFFVNLAANKYWEYPFDITKDGSPIIIIEKDSFRLGFNNKSIKFNPIGKMIN